MRILSNHTQTIHPKHRDTRQPFNNHTTAIRIAVGSETQEYPNSTSEIVSQISASCKNYLNRKTSISYKSFYYTHTTPTDPSFYATCLSTLTSTHCLRRGLSAPSRIPDDKTKPSNQKNDGLHSHGIQPVHFDPASDCRLLLPQGIVERLLCP